MAALLTAVAIGRGDVVAVDGVADKRDRARELGATTVLDPAELASSGARCDVVVEAAGNAPAFEAALAATAPGGRTVTVGLPHPDARARVSPLQLVAEARTVIGSYLGSAVPSRDIPVFAQWWREGRLPVEALVSSRIGLDDVNRAMDELAARYREQVEQLESSLREYQNSSDERRREIDQAQAQIARRAE